MTIGDVILGGYVPTDGEILFWLVLKHEGVEGCGCALALARLHTPGRLNRESPGVSSRASC